jgi:hypothetical protein
VRARGAVNLFTIVLLLALAALAYAGWLYVPLFMDNLDMREAASATFNRLAHDNDDVGVRAYFLTRANAIGTHWERKDGALVEVKGLGLTEADVVLERDPVERSGHVQADYERSVRLWPLERFQSFDFHVEKAGKFP